MKTFETIIQMARKMGGTRGGEVQFEGDKAYLTNVKRSSLYKFDLKEPIGEGTFYSSQALLNAEKIERRDDKVWFTWKENGTTRREFVANLEPLHDFEKTFDSLYEDDGVQIPKKLFDVVMADFLISKIKIKDNKIILTQIRSDGSVGFENEVPLRRGLIEVTHPDTEELSFFTGDLLLLQPIIEDKIFMKIGKYISIKVPLSFGTCRAVLGKLIYE